MLWGANLPKGGGIRLRNAFNFTIQNCVIRDNKAANGGGINVAIGSVILINTKIFDNFLQTREMELFPRVMAEESLTMKSDEVFMKTTLG